MSVTSAARCLSTGSPNSRIVYGAMSARLTAAASALTRERVDVDAQASRGTGRAASASASASDERGPPSHVPFAGPRHVDAERRAQQSTMNASAASPETAASAVAGGKPQHRVASGLRIAQRVSGSACSAASSTSWFGQPGLHEQPDPGAPASDQPGGAGEQRQGLLGGAVAGRQQLLVEVEEGHRVGLGHPVEHGLGADEHARAAPVVVVGRDLADRLPGERLELLARRGSRRRAGS